MIINIIYVIVSFFVDNLLANYFNYNTLSYLMVDIVISILVILYFRNNLKTYLVFCVVIGFIYDLLYYDIPFNIIIFLIIGLIIKLFFDYFKKNIVNVVVVTCLVIFIYNFFLFLISVIYYKSGYVMTDFINKFTHSLIINIIYNVISYILLCRKVSMKIIKK